MPCGTAAGNDRSSPAAVDRWCLLLGGLYLAGELLRADGFTDVQYIQGDPKVDQWAWIANGDTISA